MAFHFYFACGTVRVSHTVRRGFVYGLSSTDQEAAQILGKFFSSVFVHEPAMQQQLEDTVQGINQTDNLEVIIDEETVKKKLLKLQEDKAQGSDNI